MRTNRWAVAAAALMAIHVQVQAADALSGQLSLGDLSYSLTSLDGVSTPQVGYALAYVNPGVGGVSLSSGGGLIQGSMSMADGIWLSNQYETVSMAAPFPSSEASTSYSDGISHTSTSVSAVQLNTSVGVDTANLSTLLTQANNENGYSVISFASLHPGTPPEIYPAPNANAWQVTLSAQSSLTLSTTVNVNYSMDDVALQSALAASDIPLDVAVWAQGAAMLVELDPATGQPVVFSTILELGTQLSPDQNVIEFSYPLSLELTNDTNADKTFLIGYGALSGFYVQVTPSAVVPEPGTWALMGLGLGLMGWRVRRDRAASRNLA